MNYVDLLLLIVFLLAIWAGITRGFILSFTGLAAWVVSIVVAFMFYRHLADFIEENISTGFGVWLHPLSFLLAFIIMRMIISMITISLLSRVPAEAHKHSVNKALGAIPGLLNGLIWAALLVALLLAFPLLDKLHSGIQTSKTANTLLAGVEWVETKCAGIFGDAVEQTMNRITVKQDSKESISLPFTTTHANQRADLEQRMLEMINEERAREGLHPLKADPELAVVARAHSRDMFARGYFSHYTPEGRNAVYRMRQGGVRYLVAGENLALAHTLPLAHRGLMNSPGHRANILNSAFGRVGIGILDGGIHGLMVTQNFRN